MAIKTFKNRGLEKFFLSGSKAGIQPAHASKLRRQLDKLNQITAPGQMDAPGWDYHPLTGPMAGKHAVSVNGNFRLVWEWEDGQPVRVDYGDYH